MLQSDLYDDAERLNAYGKRHPDTWTGLKFEGARLIGLCTDPDLHRAPVLALMTYPEAVELRATPYSRRHLDTVYAAVKAVSERERDSWTSRGPGLIAAQIAFKGGYEYLAADLHGRFGAAVELSVGAFPYPPSTTAANRLRPAPTSTIELPDVRFDVAPAAASFRVRSAVRGDVHLTNESRRTRVVIDTNQPLDGFVLNEKHEVIGYSGMGKAGSGFGARLEPGESATIGFFAGVDSLDLRLGTNLPAGDYLLVVEIPLFGERVRGRVVTAPVPIRLID